VVADVRAVLRTAGAGSCRAAGTAARTAVIAAATVAVVLVVAGCGGGSPQARITRTVTVAASTSPASSGPEVTPEADTSSTTSTTVVEPVTPTPRPKKAAASPTFTGHVRTPQGRGAAGVVVEFKKYPYCPDVCQERFVHTDSHGAYAITLPAGTYNALCVVDIGWECAAAGGDGGPHLVEVPPAGQTVDFVACPEDDYPACLG
jgi:hypothetical protein